MDEPINIEVAYATPAKQSLIELTVPKGSTVEQGTATPKVAGSTPAALSTHWTSRPSVRPSFSHNDKVGSTPAWFSLHVGAVAKW